MGRMGRMGRMGDDFYSDGFLGNGRNGRNGRMGEWENGGGMGEWENGRMGEKECILLLITYYLIKDGENGENGKK